MLCSFWMMLSGEMFWLMLGFEEQLSSLKRDFYEELVRETFVSFFQISIVLVRIIMKTQTND